MILALALTFAPQLEKIGVVRFDAVAEMSGIVPSSRYSGTYWVHNDSGDSARIFPIRRDGSSAMVKADKKWAGIAIKDARNVDWEDITSDGKNLYISDMGNNGNERKNLGVYVIEEPNPSATEVARFKFIPLSYPDQTEFPPKNWDYDCEAVFWLRNKLYFVTKHRRSKFFPVDSTNLYRLDFVDRKNQLTKIDHADSLGGWVTGAAVSPDGSTIALLCQAPLQRVWLYSTQAKNDKFFAAGGRSIGLSNVKQAEGICFESNSALIITNEQREIYRLTL
ncbi:MAG: hypothetical protein ABL949_12140 [Fimbriimonadaceae bacterium]